MKKDNSIAIRNIVNLVKRIVATKDTEFEQDATRHYASTLMLELVANFREQPKFVAAILQYCHDCGFNIVNSNKGESSEKFVTAFGSRIARMNEEQIARVREINNRLFQAA